MKSFIKAILNQLALVLVLPVFAMFCLGRACLGTNRVFPGFSQTLSLLPGNAGVYCRRAFYWLVLSRCGDDACIEFGTIISHPTAEIGRTVYIGAFCCIGDVTLEEDVIVASHVSIINGNAQHGIERLDVPIREQPGVWPRITIGRDSWIGERAVIQADIGQHCVIGAGSVVVKPIPDYAVAVGVPAKVIRFRNQLDPTKESDKCVVPPLSIHRPGLRMVDS
jgi:acetyltransferase-like isoleucine patch superfamily enzyme